MSMRLAMYAAMGSAMRSANGAGGGGGTGPIDPMAPSRNVTRLNGVAARFAAFTPHVSPTNWHYVVPVYIDELGTVQQLLASADNSSLFHIKTDGTLKVKLDGVSAAIYLDFNTVMAKAGQINIYILKGNGSSVTVELNGVSTVQPTAAYNPPVVDYIGSKVSSDYLEGYFFDLVLDNKIYPLNSTSTIHLPVGSELGPELADGDFGVSGHYDESGDNWVIPNGNSWGAYVFHQDIPVEAGRTYSYRIDGIGTGTKVWTSPTTIAADFVSQASAGIGKWGVITIPSGSAYMRMALQGGATAGIQQIDSLTVQEIPVERGQELWTLGSSFPVDETAGSQILLRDNNLRDAMQPSTSYQVSFFNNTNNSARLFLTANAFVTVSAQQTYSGVLNTGATIDPKGYFSTTSSGVPILGTIEGVTIKEISSDYLVAEQTATDGSDIEQWTKTDEGFIGPELSKISTASMDTLETGVGSGFAYWYMTTESNPVETPLRLSMEVTDAVNGPRMGLSSSSGPDSIRKDHCVNGDIIGGDYLSKVNNSQKMFIQEIEGESGGFKNITLKQRFEYAEQAET